MALKPCRECKKEVSTQAKTCPNCGVKNPSGTLSAGTGGCLAVVVLLGILVVFVNAPGNRPSPQATPELPAEIPIPEPEARVNLSLSVDSCTSRGNYLWTEGSVTNDSEVTVRFVTVRLTWEDSDGDVVDTGSTYAVGGESLRPGETSGFSGNTQHPSAQRCVASLLDYRQ
jgi:hypothetical protein